MVMGWCFDTAASDAVLAKPRRAPPAPKTKEELVTGERGCDACPLQETWERLGTPQMRLSGAKAGDILALGEAPGEEEDDRGEAFVGPTGRMLRQHIPHRQMERVAFANAARCRPPGNRTPTGHELHCCSIHLETDIQMGAFKAILGLGGTPLRRFFDEAPISHMVGVKFPVEIGDKVLWY